MAHAIDRAHNVPRGGAMKLRMLAGAIVASSFAASAATATPVASIPRAQHVPTAPNDKLQYYGGRVISNVEIVEVFWGPNVDATLVAQIGSFYTAIVKSSYIDWLTEYDTIGKVGLADNMPGTNQHIGRGTYAGAKTITPMNQSSTLTDAQVAAELVAQIQGGHLPQPTLDSAGNVNTLYMIDFPPGVTITLMAIQSCQQFGAYHFTVAYNGKSLPYGVHPDCNYDFDTRTSIHSHELIEALTDTEVGLAEQLSPTKRPIAWATVANTAWDSQEIADICEGQGSSVAFNGYKVQKVWSNFAGACVIGVPICDGMVPMPCRQCNDFDSDNACEAPKPACATSGPNAGKCVACTPTHKATCTGATPACDAMTNTCRPCQVDSECAPGVCDVSGDAQKGQCVQCNTDAQCPGAKCTAHVCAPLPPAPDAGPIVDPDAGSSPPPNGDAPSGSDGGCGCGVVGTSAPAPVGLAVAALAVALARRKKRT
jgi:MYXO-CTERM domain-containing protein